jgi:hypothetical protein
MCQQGKSIKTYLMSNGGHFHCPSMIRSKRQMWVRSDNKVMQKPHVTHGE